MSPPIRSSAVAFARYCLDVQYAGRYFGGWTSGCAVHRSLIGGTNSDKSRALPCKEDVNKIPGVLETLDAALDTFVGRDCYTNLRGSSRTDTGVSAVCNRFHVDIARPIKIRRSKEGQDDVMGTAAALAAPLIHHKDVILTDAASLPQDVQYTVEPPFDPSVVVRAMNKYLDRSQVHISDARVVDSSFDAVRSAQSRTYMYRILHTPSRYDDKGWLFQSDQAWNVYGALDAEAMQKAAAYLIGMHDFTSFRNAGCVARTPIRNVMSLEIEEYGNYGTALMQNGNIDDVAPLLIGPSRLIVVRVRANAFLYRMVRNIVSVLVKVGRGQMTPLEVQALLLARDRHKAPAPAPASGLFLTHVEYAEEAEWNKRKL